ncbi:claudin-34 [Heterocephalus glaber]|uniref:Claudin-34 n=1 Tax=Heterocephalus glaber TaxID=10181 RepID=A0AAX6R857_HETGA|nr:claudin-34 [Heterocephalus glaber]
MPVHAHATNRQVMGFAIATIAWILSSTSMGLVEWCVWNLEDPAFSHSSLICVGMWRLCIYKHDSNFSRAKRCHQYTYLDTFLPPDIRTAQYLLLATSVLGLVGKAFTIWGLQKVTMGAPPKDLPSRPFVTAGILTLAACGCVSVAAFWNCYSVADKAEIYFPLSFHMPFQPSTQEMGSAVLVAVLGAFLMLLSGTFFLSYSYPLDTQVHPEI